MIVIVRQIGGLPEYLTLKRSYAVTAPYAFTADKSAAFGFARREDAEDFMKMQRINMDHHLDVMDIKL